MKSGIEVTRASVVPAGRTWCGTDFPRTSFLAGFLRRFATFPVKEGEVGKGGQEVGKWTGFSHFGTALTRLFPHVSMQVVDFPHICNVRAFGEMRRNHRDTV